MQLKTIFALSIILGSLLTGCGGGSSGGSNTSKPTLSTGNWFKPAVTTTWQWQLQGTVNTGYNVDLYDIDLFDSSASLITSLQAMNKKVICYFSAGSFEDFRPDAAQFLASDKGNTLQGFANEQWLDIRSANVRQIMQARLDLAKQKGCDGVEPDNVDGYTNNTGFPLSAADQLAYNQFLATEAHSRGLSVGLKNDIDQAAQLVSRFDFSVNEQCHEFNECDKLAVFINAGKPVFNAEYASVFVNDSVQRQMLCTDSLSRSFRTLVLPAALDDSFRFSCD